MFKSESKKAAIVFGGILAVALLGFAMPTAYADEIECGMCHPDLDKKKNVHAAVSMGCAACHAELNAAEVPHKLTGSAPKGLSSAQPDLCFGCHGKDMFTKKNVHGALQMGCTTCHNPHASDEQKLLVAGMPSVCFNCHDKSQFEKKTVHPPVAGGMCTSCHSPHSSDNAKLVIAEVPGLCLNCHDNTLFSRKNVHMPVAGGMCLNCHSPHASDEMTLLLKRPAAVCLDCHANIAKTRHVVGDFQHPISTDQKKGEKQPANQKEGESEEKDKGPLMDPARQDKEFYCGSCHEPHSSDFRTLMRYKANSPFELCLYCHKK